MNKLLLLHGPNLNMLGKRDQNHYGSLTLKELEKNLTCMAKSQGYKIQCYQSNYEGKLIKLIQSKSKHCSGIIINPGALSHYSYAIHDALVDCNIPTIEVHLSKISEREKWRQQSVISAACVETIEGLQINGYHQAIKNMIERTRNE